VLFEGVPIEMQDLMLIHMVEAFNFPFLIRR